MVPIKDAQLLERQSRLQKELLALIQQNASVESVEKNASEFNTTHSILLKCGFIDHPYFNDRVYEKTVIAVKAYKQSLMKAEVGDQNKPGTSDATSAPSLEARHIESQLKAESLSRLTRPIDSQSNAGSLARSPKPVDSLVEDLDDMAEMARGAIRETDAYKEMAAVSTVMVCHRRLEFIMGKINVMVETLKSRYHNQTFNRREINRLEMDITTALIKLSERSKELEHANRPVFPKQEARASEIDIAELPKLAQTYSTIHCVKSINIEIRNF